MGEFSQVVFPVVGMSEPLLFSFDVEESWEADAALEWPVLACPVPGCGALSSPTVSEVELIVHLNKVHGVDVEKLAEELGSVFAFLVSVVKRKQLEGAQALWNLMNSADCIAEAAELAIQTALAVQAKERAILVESGTQNEVETHRGTQSAGTQNEMETHRGTQNAGTRIEVETHHGRQSAGTQNEVETHRGTQNAPEGTPSAVLTFVLSQDATLHPCPFCGHVPSEAGTRWRTSMFEHMEKVHGFSGGAVDNVMSVNGMLAMIRSFIDANRCIYCRHTFKSDKTLRSHMKKKKHFRIHRENADFDPFYIVHYCGVSIKGGSNTSGSNTSGSNTSGSNTSGSNTSGSNTSGSNTSGSNTSGSNTSGLDGFLGLGKSKSGSDFADDHTLPVSVSPNTAVNLLPPEEEVLPQVDDTSGQRLVCLFCTFQDSLFDSMFTHMKEKHDFDLVGFKKTHGLDFYDTVKLINFIRRQIYANVCCLCGLTCDQFAQRLTHQQSLGHCKVDPEQPAWQEEHYLFPTYENDALLRAFCLGD